MLFDLPFGGPALGFSDAWYSAHTIVCKLDDGSKVNRVFDVVDVDLEDGVSVMNNGRSEHHRTRQSVERQDYLIDAYVEVTVGRGDHPVITTTKADQEEARTETEDDLITLDNTHVGEVHYYGFRTIPGSYQRGSTTLVDDQPIVEISKKLHTLPPVYEPTKSSKHREIVLEPSIGQAEAKAVSVIARAILSSDDRLQCVLPIRLRSNKDQHISRYRKHFALFIALRDGSQTILPLSLWIWGSSTEATRNAYNDSNFTVEPYRPAPFPHPYTDLVAKFQCHPVMTYNDVRFTNGQATSSPCFYRKYETVWGITDEARSVTLSEPVFHNFSIRVDGQKAESIFGWCLYTTCAGIVRKMLSSCSERPFELVHSNTFDFTDQKLINTISTGNVRYGVPVNNDMNVLDEEDMIEDQIWDRNCRSWPVGDQIFCILDFDRTEPRRPGSRFCTIHHRCMADEVLQGHSNILHQLQRSVEFLYQPDSHRFDDLRHPHELSHVGHRCGVHYHATTILRNLKTGVEIISTAVDYSSMTMEEMHNEARDSIVPWMGRTAMASVSRVFRDFYQGKVTGGSTFSTIGQQAIQQGFNPDTHRILCWYSRNDIFTSYRTLSGMDDLMTMEDTGLHQIICDSRVRNIMQPVDLGHVLNKLTNLETMKL
ncbi:hypothetical protein CC80DRAFT_505364 [Byssothecium circinans]|uniref:Uncharacterized protein n=1 Tax=Byssothecium circinans TaxID=147558 RepID=A0A6A5TRB1_9PLEO|nr:hypothetical protein CC80DRAFT_505364 [Byssothecium circinans]